MNKSFLVGSVLGAVLITAGGSYAGYQMLGGEAAPEFANIVNVESVTETQKTPREVCEQVAVTKQVPVKDQNKVAGMAIGAVVGGLLGRQVGGGNGRRIATVVGAAAGAFAGNKQQERMQQNDTYTDYETRCNTVYDTSERILGYDVTYKIGEELSTIRMDKKPQGTQLPLVDGKIAMQAAFN